jgi:hypothetical protein
MNKRNTQDRDREYGWADRVAPWLALVAALIGLAAVVLGFFLKIEVGRIDNKVKALSETACPVTVKITLPQQNNEVGTRLTVKGTCTFDTRCLNVFVMIKPLVPGKDLRYVAAKCQVNEMGEWETKVALDKDLIFVDTEALVQAVVTSNPTAYRINQILQVPPWQGVQSMPVKIRRIR